jgi:hypothetical protein
MEADRTDRRNVALAHSSPVETLQDLRESHLTVGQIVLTPLDPVWKHEGDARSRADEMLDRLVVERAVERVSGGLDIVDLWWFVRGFRDAEDIRVIGKSHFDETGPAGKSHEFHGFDRV